MIEIQFSPPAWEQYLDWQMKDTKTLKRINALLKDIVRGTPHEGIGKPEQLRGNLSGCWSRGIDNQNRLVYRICGENTTICQIAQCKGHYGE